MANKDEEVMQEIIGFMEKTGSKSVPCSVLANIASKHCCDGSKVVTLFLKASASDS